MVHPASATTYAPASALWGRVGCIVPVWFPGRVDAEEAAVYLRTTLAGTTTCLDPQDLLLVIDGCAAAAAAAERLRTEFAAEWGTPFQLMTLPQNRGKGGALSAGLERVLAEKPQLDWIAFRDADGDHFIDDLPHFFRLGEQLAATDGERSSVPALVIGRRSAVHPSLGWMRAEFELLCNQVIVESAAYALARSGRVWDTRFLVDRVPDLQSGYKFFNRAAAEIALHAFIHEAALHPDLDLPRIGMEVAPFLRAVLAGCRVGEVERKSWYDQPVTAYGSIDFASYYGGKLVWALRACEIPPDVVPILIDSALAVRPLFADPEGRTRALAMRRYVHERLGLPDPGPPLLRRLV